MNKRFSLFLDLFILCTLTGCFGEDYDVGVPTAYLDTHAHLNIGAEHVQLTAANTNWKSSSGEVEKTIENTEEYGSSQEEIKVFPNQSFFRFQREC
ncbi:hypothetical protein [Virgibacillus senegalensis]|uniref:hypothetical protein n=1 Tax=Virgibacillus senegalensis TaxID=1499679 RepID=UPI00069D766B|nr:hypothetical protein [Virgibacillus senegalensis]